MADERASDRQRIDKWLVYARVVKTRTLGQALAASGFDDIDKLAVNIIEQRLTDRALQRNAQQSQTQHQLAQRMWAIGLGGLVLALAASYWLARRTSLRMQSIADALMQMVHAPHSQPNLLHIQKLHQQSHGPVQQLAGAFGTAVFVTVFAAQSDAHKATGAGVEESLLYGSHLAFLGAGAVWLLAIVATGFLRTPEPSDEMPAVH